MGCRKEVTAAIQMSNEGSLEVGVKKVVRSIKGSGLRDSGKVGGRDGLGVSGLGGGIVTGYTNPTEKKVKFREEIPG